LQLAPGKKQAAADGRANEWVSGKSAVLVLQCAWATWIRTSQRSAPVSRRPKQSPHHCHYTQWI